MHLSYIGQSAQNPMGYILINLRLTKLQVSKVSLLIQGSSCETVNIFNKNDEL